MNLSADQLRFLLVRGRTELGALRIFDSRQIVWRERRVAFYVLGASHAVSIECGTGVPLFEVLSCASAIGAGEILVSSSANAPQELSITVGDLQYACRLTPFALSAWADRFERAYPASDRLRVAYAPSDAGAVPVTHVGWRAGGELTIETVHTYPREGRGVRSESRVAVVRGPQAT